MRPKRTIFHDLRDDGRLSARFWTKVARSSTDACWLWIAYRPTRPGHDYGKIGIAGRVHFAHRIAWELTNGPVPDGLRVLHVCDNPPCCNPAHLFLGTQNDNMRDMWDKGRHGPRQARTGHPCRGEAHHDSKLTAADVLEIRRLASDGVRQDVLGARYGVTRQSIWAIVHRKKWKHV